MLIPVGVGESEVRRTPWVSVALLVLLVALFMAGVHGGVSAKQAREFAQELERTAEFWLEHPWLEAPEGLADVLGGDLFDQLSEEVEEGRCAAEQSRAVPVPLVVAKQQEELDALFDRAVRLFRERGDRGLSYVPARPEAKALVTHMFLHGGFWHLFGGAFAAGAHGLFTLSPDVPLLGASGALAAVMGAFFIRLGRSHIRFLFVPILFLPMIRFLFALPAFVVLPLWFGEQVLAARLLPSAPVAWWAHIGGFAFGMAVALLREVRDSLADVLPARFFLAAAPP